MTAASEAQKQHNTEATLRAKVGIRANVVAELRQLGARLDIFDAFCGASEGVLWRDVWKDAATSYAGCDELFTWPDPRRRFVGDNRRIMRSIDLRAFNVFDFDAFGSPWEQMVILAHHRVWAPGEVGAVVLTDGSPSTKQLGSAPRGLAAWLGISGSTASMAGLPPMGEASITLREIALQRWLARCDLTPIRVWKAEARGARPKFRIGLEAVVFRAGGGGLARSAPPLEAPPPPLAGAAKERVA